MAEKEYIERESVLRSLAVLLQMPFTDLDDAWEVAQKTPAADVVEVRHGEWLLRHVGHGHYWECSACHTNPCIYVTENTKFCPNCGAKMDGGADNG